MAEDHAPEDGAEARFDYGVPPVARAFKLLRYIAAGNGCANLTRAARETGINRTTLIRLLATLADERMIDQGPDGRYHLGTGLIGLAAAAMSSLDLSRAARPRLARLAHDTRLSAHLGVLDGREVVYLVREVPRAHLVSNVHEGTRLPAHATTMGRMMLAQLDEGALNSLYSGREMPEYSSVTATSLAELKVQLAQDRLRGIVWSDGNFEPSIGSCATAVRDHTGAVIAAINLSGPRSEFEVGTPRADEIDAAIRAATADISAALGWAG